MSSDESYLPDFFTSDQLEWYRSLSERLSSVEWAYRLRFPILSRDEIKLIRDVLAKSSHPTRRPKIARALLRSRLARSGISISDNRLREKIKAAS